MINLKENRLTKLNTVELTKHDKVYLQALVKRQYMILKDMYTFHDAYPTVLDADVMGSYDTLFRVLADLCDNQLALN